MPNTDNFAPCAHTFIHRDLIHRKPIPTPTRHRRTPPGSLYQRVASCTISPPHSASQLIQSLYIFVQGTILITMSQSFAMPTRGRIARWTSHLVWSSGHYWWYEERAIWLA